ncbi:MAG: hypothetical protein AABX14_04930 [Candidatus Aenigmatarchaeota archaeon]
MKILFIIAILVLLLTGTAHAYYSRGIFIGSSNNYGSYNSYGSYGGYYTYPRYSYYNPSTITTFPNYYGGSYSSRSSFNIRFGW